MADEINLLSAREKGVARILLQGKSNKQIALELGISNRTVEFHLRNIYTKLDVASRTEAILKLAESDLWRTPGAFPVESTVAATGDPSENDPNIISWRIPVRTLYYALGGLLITILVVVVTVIDRVPAIDVNPSPTSILPITTTLVELPTA